MAGLAADTALVIALCLWIPAAGVIWYWLYKRTKDKLKEKEEELITELKGRKAGVEDRERHSF